MKTNNEKLMSVWDTIPAESEDNSNSQFLNKALGDGDELKLQFVDVQHEDQRENTPDAYKTPDGKEWVLYFVDENGKERTMTQRSTKGKLLVAMREANIQKDAWIWVKREGLELETEYLVRLDGETPTVNTPGEAAPF